MNTSQKDWPENARIVRCLRAWFESNPQCYCDFPDFEEDGIIYTGACEVRNAIGVSHCEAHMQRFAALEKQTEERAKSGGRP